MRAVVVSEYGGTPVLAEVPTPQPGPGQILMRMRAAGMNPMDRTLASGDWQPAPATFPMVLGADGEGVVESVGEGTKRFSRGDDLFGQLLIAPIGSAGTYADYVVVTEDASLARVPDGIDALLDLVSQAEAFSALASLVRSGGTAVTTQYVADVDALAAAGVTGINFAFQASTELLERLADALVSGRIVAPPITRIALEEAPAVLSQAQPRPADGKTVIKL